MHRYMVIAASLLMTAAIATAADAAPITFTFSGSGTGTDNGVAFANAAFSITGLADTSNVEPFPGQPGTIFLPFTSASMSLAGFAVNGSISPDLGIYDFSGYGGLESIVAGVPGYNLISGIPGNYNLTSSLGPVTFSPTDFGQFNNGFLLNGNQVNFTSMGTVTFTAVASPATSDVPEPFTLSLFGAGLLGAGALRRRRSKNKT